jgi:hypothetical protein
LKQLIFSDHLLSTIHIYKLSFRTFKATSKRDGKLIAKPDPKKFLDFMDSLEHKLQTDALHNIGKTRA